MGIMIQLNEGYSIRHIFQIIKKEKPDKVCFIFTPKGFNIIADCSNKKSCHYVSIDATEIEGYTYGINTSDNIEDERYAICFDYEQMYGALSTIQKKDGVRIYWLVNSQCFKIQIIKSGIKDPKDSGGSNVDIIEDDGIDFDDIYDNLNIKTPNIKVSIENFNIECKNITNQACDVMKIIGYQDYIIIKGIDKQGISRFDKKFVSSINHSQKIENHSVNTISMEDAVKSLSLTDDKPKKKIIIRKKTDLIVNEDKDINNCITQITLNNQIAKSYTKILQIAPDKANIRFFYKKDQAMKIEFDVKNYGVYKIFIR